MEIELIFNEPIDPDTLDVRHIMIQNEQSPFPEFSYSLTEAGAVYTSDFSTVLTFGLSTVDRNAIQSIPELSNNATNTFIAINPEAIMDTSGNMVARVSPTLALSASTYQEDTVRPRLESFSLDLERRILRLSFSESVNTSTLNLSLIELHNLA